jgi:hypothetical protein
MPLKARDLKPFTLTPNKVHPSREDDFAFQCRAFKLPPFVRQYRFAKELGRMWQFDFAFVEYKLAVEIEGLVVKRIGGQLVTLGRHVSISGFKEDCIKYSTAAEELWTVIRFEQSQVKDGTAIDRTQRNLLKRGWKP